MTTDREKILETIRNLRAKAGDSAASEAEASAAAMMAARLLIKHDVNETELEINKTEGAHSTFGEAKVVPAVLMACWSGIQKLTETKMYVDGSKFCAIGMPHDVEMAVYLMEMIVGASKRGWADSGFVGKASAMMIRRASYMEGFGQNINQRLYEMALMRERAKNDAHSNSTALVVAKEGVIARKMEEMGLNLVPGGERRRRLPLDPISFGMGVGDGSKVNLQRPVEGADAMGAIE